MACAQQIPPGTAQSVKRTQGALGPTLLIPQGYLGSTTEGLSSLRLAGLRGLQAPSGVAHETVHSAELAERLVEVGVDGRL